MVVFPDNEKNRSDLVLGVAACRFCSSLLWQTDKTSSISIYANVNSDRLTDPSTHNSWKRHLGSPPLLAGFLFYRTTR